MANNIHHVTVVVRDSQRFVRFADRVLGMGLSASFAVLRNDIAALMNWPVGPGEVDSFILGNSRGGLLEVVQMPRDLIGQVPNALGPGGIFQLCLEVEDLDTAMTRAAAFSADSIAGPTDVAIAGRAIRVGLVWMDEIRFQLTQISHG